MFSLRPPLEGRRAIIQQGGDSQDELLWLHQSDEGSQPLMSSVHFPRHMLPDPSSSTSSVVFFKEDSGICNFLLVTCLIARV